MSKNVSKKATYNKQQKEISVAWRFYVVIGVIIVVYACLIARSAFIQVIEPDMLKNVKTDQIKQ